jgi:hypothetical protein
LASKKKATKVIGYISGDFRLLTMDSVTRLAFDAATSSSAKADVVIAALGSTVSVVVYDGSNAVKGSGTMTNPWAVRSGNSITVGQLASFSVSSTGTPDVDWYLRFEGNSRWVRGSFALSSGSADFLWSLSTWESGQTGRISTVSGYVPLVSITADVAGDYDVMPTTFGWNIPDTTYSVPGTFYSGTAGQTYNTAQHVTDPGDVGVYSITEQRKNGVVGSYGIAVVADTGLLTLPSTLATPSGSSDTYLVTVDVTPQITATQDWATRSQQPGVVWAHDFSETNEVYAWRFGEGSFAPQPANALDCQRIAVSGLGSSGAMVSTIRGTTLTAPVAANATVLNVADASQFPDPVLYPNYQVLVGPESGPEWFTVTGRNTSINTLTGTKSNLSMTHNPGEGVSYKDRTGWNRPMGAFSSAENGKTTNDIGIQNGYKNRDVDLYEGGGSPMARSVYRFRGAYWGHPSYRELYHAVWPINGYDTYSTGIDASYTNTFDSSALTGEFYISFAMKVSASRFNNPRGKLFYLQTVNETSQQQLYCTLDTTAGNKVTMSTTQGGTAVFELRRPDNSIYQIPPDEWRTYRIHVIPGRHQVAETTVEFHVAENGAWVTLGSTNSLALTYTTVDPAVGNPPAYNSFRPENYANHYVGDGTVGASISTHSIQYTQIILSRNAIAPPSA